MRTPMRVVEHAEHPAPAVDLKPGMSVWQQVLLMAASAAIAGGSSWAGSHWGGVTNDQLNEALAKQEKALVARIDAVGAQVAKDSDDMRKYVDAKTAAPKAAPKKPKKKAEPQGGTE